MATLKQLQGMAEAELGFEVDDTDILIASYLCHGMSQSEICETLAVDAKDLMQLVEGEEFQAIRQVIQLEIASSKIDIDGGWDSAERMALEAVNDFVGENQLDIDMALKIAAIANKAERRGEKGNQVIGGQQGGLVTISLKQTFVQALQTGGVAKEIPQGTAQVVVGESLEIHPEERTEGSGNPMKEGIPASVSAALEGRGQVGLNGFAQSIQPDAKELDEVLGLSHAVKNQGNGGGSLLDMNIDSEGSNA